MKPITRKEYYLAKAAGTYTGPTPPPVLREDYYLATLAGDYSGYCPAPVTRIEKYMSAAAGLTSYVPQPVTRIEKYWYAIAKGTGYVPEPVTREERFLYALVQNKPGPPKPEYVDKTAEGNPILLTDSAEASFTALTIYGHSTQDGTPSPENPVPIVSAGDSGEINVTVGGAQLIQSENPISNQDIVVGDLQAGTYTYSNNIVSVISEIMLNIGSTALPYEPYKTPQTLTLSTPGGLPGIPVSSGGNYTDESGQQWICDEIDLKRGKYVQRVVEADFDGTETWETWGVNNLTEGITGFYSYVPSGFQKVLTNGMLSNLLQYADSAWGGGAYGINMSNPNTNQYIICSIRNEYLDDISTDDAVISSWKNILNKNNLHVMLILQDPIETDLPAEEIAAYKALHTYSPTTTVTNDADAWMKVGYKATP